MRSHFLLNTFSVTEIDKDYYYWVPQLGILCCCNSNSYESKIVYKENDAAEKYSVCVKLSDYLLLVPFRYSRLALYNYHSKTCEYIDCEENAMFCRAYAQNDVVVLWRWGKRGLAKFDLISKKITPIKGTETIQIASNGCVVNDNIYGYDSESKKIFKFNSIDNSVAFIEISDFDLEVSTISYVNGELWLSGNKDKICKYSIEAETFCELDINSITYKDQFWSEDLFMDSHVKDSKVYFSPYKANELISIDINTMKTTVECTIEKDEIGGSLIDIKDGLLWIISPLSGELAARQYMLYGNIAERRDILYVSDGSELINRNKLCDESELRQLKDFVAFICSMDDHKV